MSSTQEETSGLNRRGARGGANRRTWSQREEAVLLTAIRELIAQGFKSDNGFRAGYLGRLEDGMRREFPTTNLKGHPHINSKICSWKKTYYSLDCILSRSGVGFNSKGTFMIEVEDDTWDSIVKVDPAARNMRYRQWPYYEAWQEIFGRDRATGEAAEDLVDAFNDITQEGNSQNAGNGDGFGNAYSMFPTEDEGDTSFSQRKGGVAAATSREKRRKMSREIEEVCAVIDRIGRSSDARLDNLACRFGYEFALDVKKKEAFEKMRYMDFLTVDQRFVICELLSKELDKLEVFRNMPDEMLPCYVQHLLRNVAN